MFSEKFVLKGTPVDTGISKYHTWEYVGQKYVYIPEVEREANYEITIDKNRKFERLSDHILNRDKIEIVFETVKSEIVGR